MVNWTRSDETCHLFIRDVFSVLTEKIQVFTIGVAEYLNRELLWQNKEGDHTRQDVVFRQVMVWVISPEGHSRLWMVSFIPLRTSVYLKTSAKAVVKRVLFVFVFVSKNSWTAELAA